MTAPAALITPRLTTRLFQSEEDWWLVRNLIIETHAITGPDFNWELRHWDGNGFHDAVPGWEQEKFKKFCLWETEEGRLAGLAHNSYTGELSMEIHPDFRDRIEEEMIAYGEAHYAEPTEDGKHSLMLTVYEYDAPRKRILIERGYQKRGDGWVSRYMRICNRPIPTPQIAEGYTMRATETSWEECQKMADLLNIAFGRVNFHQPEDYWSFITRSPSFRHDLNLVAVAPDGSFAAHVGLTYDEANCFAIFEPVCTHPDHRRRRLAQTLMFEGLHRVKALGATHITVSTGDDPGANALYESIGFTEAYKAYHWAKVF